MGFIVKNTTFPGLLDLIAPHSCRGCGKLGSPICYRCKNNLILDHTNACPNCKGPNPTGKCAKCGNMPPSFVVGDRADLVGKLLYDLKYNSVRALAWPIGEILDEILPRIDGAASIVPLPTIDKHIRERGLDHTYAVAKSFAKIRGTNCNVEKLIVRTKNTVQVGANRETRILQAKNAYMLSHKIAIDPNTTYILFDDVWTTGASMKAAIKILKKAGGKKIIVVVLAMAK